MRSQSTLSSARFSCCDGLSWVSDEPVDDMLVRALFVAKDVVFLENLCMNSLSDGSLIRISLGADKEIVSCQAQHVNFVLAVLEVTGQLVDRVCNPYPNQGDRDGQEDEACCSITRAVVLQWWSTFS